MPEIFVNLKRFDIPEDLGGICPVGNPADWITGIMGDVVVSGILDIEQVNLTFLLPESLIMSAFDALRESGMSDRVGIGPQGVYRDDVAAGGNFGAFTSNITAKAAAAMGCRWTMVGHSEERKDKLGILRAYQEEIDQVKAAEVVDRLVGEEAVCGAKAGLKILICIGETADEAGGGTLEEKKPRIENALARQISVGLSSLYDVLGDNLSQKVVIGYEPVWAIGPGKTPPGADYVGCVSAFIKRYAESCFGASPKVVYGGGLKEDNAAMLARVPDIEGGLVALTRFTGKIGFNTDELKIIIENYIEGESR